MGLINSLLSYLMLVIVFVAVAGAGLLIGLFLRRRKNAQEAAGGAECEG